MLLNGSALNVAWLSGATGTIKSLACLTWCGALQQASLTAAKACHSQSAAISDVLGSASIQKTIGVQALATEYVSAWLALGFQLRGDGSAQAQMAGVLQKIAALGAGTSAQVALQTYAQAKATVNFSLQGQALSTAESIATLAQQAKLASNAVGDVFSTGDASVAYAVSAHLRAQATGEVSAVTTISLGGIAMGVVQAQAVPTLQVKLKAGGEVSVGVVSADESGALYVVQSLIAHASGLAMGMASVLKTNRLEASSTAQSLTQGQLGARLFIASQLDAAVQAQAPLTKLCTMVAAAKVSAQVLAAGGVLHHCESNAFVYVHRQGGLASEKPLEALTFSQAAGYALASLDVPLQALTAQAIASVQGLASLSKRCDAACFALTQLDGQGLIAKTIGALGKADGSVSAEVVLTKQCEAQGLASVQSFAASDLSKPLAIITAMGLAQTLGDAYLLKHLTVSAQALVATQTQLGLGRPLESITAHGEVQSSGHASITKLIGGVAAGGVAQVMAQAQLTKPISVTSQAVSSVIALAAINKPLALAASSSAALGGEAALEKMLAIHAQAKALSGAQALVEKSLALFADAHVSTQAQALDITKRLALQAQAITTTTGDAFVLKTIDAHAQAVASLSAEASCTKTSQAQGVCVALSDASVDLRIPLGGSLRLENLASGTCSLTKRLDGAGDAPFSSSPSLSLAVWLGGDLLECVEHKPIDMLITKRLEGIDVAMTVTESAHLKRLYQHKRIHLNARSLAPRLSVDLIDAARR